MNVYVSFQLAYQCQPIVLTLQNMLACHMNLTCHSAGILNRVAWMQRVYPMTQHDVVAFKTSPSFVDHLWEMFAPHLTGNGLAV